MKKEINQNLIRVTVQMVTYVKGRVHKTLFSLLFHYLKCNQFIFHISTALVLVGSCWGTVINACDCENIFVRYEKLNLILKYLFYGNSDFKNLKCNPVLRNRL